MREFYAYVWRSSASRQIVLIILAISAALLAMAPLELQRHIINTLAGHEKANRLAWLCGAYLTAAFGIGGLKYILNIKSAGLGESMILSLRQDMFSSSSPLGSDGTSAETTKDKAAGTFVTMISSEAEAVWEVCRRLHFNPDGAGRDPAQRVGLHALYRAPSRPGRFVYRRSQVFAVPMIQRRINTLVRERVRSLRHAGDLTVENMQGGGQSTGSLGSEIGKAFETIYGVRLRVFKLKFGLKFLVSGLESVGVFALLFFGGIMVLNGKTEIGIVVAFISGLGRVLDPWRELIAFVRSTSAAKVQFDLIEGTLGRKL